MAKFFLNPLGLVVVALGLSILILGAAGVNFVGGHTQSITGWGTLNIFPASTNLGSTVQISGSGFNPNGYVTLTFTRVSDNGPWLPDATPARIPVDANGNFAVPVTAGPDPNCPAQCGVHVAAADNGASTTYAYNDFMVVQGTISCTGNLCTTTTATVTSSATSIYGNYILQLAFADCSGNYVPSGVVSVTGTQITGAQFSRTSNIDPSIHRVIFSSVPAGTYLIWYNGVKVGNLVVTSDSTHQFSVCTQTTTSQTVQTSTGQTTITSQSTTTTIPVTSTITSQSAATSNVNGYTSATVTNVVTQYSAQYNPMIAVFPTQLTAKPGTLQSFTVLGSGWPDSGQVTIFFIGPTSFSFIAQLSGGTFNANGQGTVLSGSYSVYAVLNAAQQTSIVQAQTYATTNGNTVQYVVSQTVMMLSSNQNMQSNSVLISVNTNAAGLPSAHITVTPSDVVSQSGQLAITGFGFSHGNTVTLYISNAYYQSSRQFLTDSDGYFTSTIPMNGLGAGTYNVYAVDTQTGFQLGPYQIIVTSGSGAQTFQVNLPGSGQYVTQTATQTTTYPNGVTVTQTVTSASLSTSGSGLLTSLSSISGTTVEMLVGGGLGLLGAAASVIPKKP